MSIRAVNNEQLAEKDEGLLLGQELAGVVAWGVVINTSTHNIAKKNSHLNS
jgi:hypothetical protein